MNDLAKFVRTARKASGKTQETVAQETGYSVAAIRKIEKGDTSNIRRSAELADVLGVDHEELAILQERAKQEAAEGKQPNAKLVSLAKTITPRRGTIPVIGRAAASGEPGKLIMLDEVTEYIPTHPELEGVTDAFAVYVYGDSMIPRYFPNEKVYVHPYRQVSRGDFCVIQVGNPDPECAYVKRFVSFDDHELVVEQYNPPIQIRFPKSDVYSIGMVVGTSKS